MPFWKKIKHSISVYMPVDNPDFKMIVAEYIGKPFLLAIGASKRRTKKAGATATLVMGKAEYNMEKDLDWEYFHNPRNLEGFMRLEDATSFMATAISAISGKTVTQEEHHSTALTKDSSIDDIVENVNTEYAVENLTDLRKELKRWKEHYL